MDSYTYIHSLGSKKHRKVTSGYFPTPKLDRSFDPKAQTTSSENVFSKDFQLIVDCKKLGLIAN